MFSKQDRTRNSFSRHKRTVLVLLVQCLIFMSHEMFPSFKEFAKSMEDKSGSAASRDFTERMNTVVFNGFLSLGLALGYEFGLFKAMCNFDRPASPGEIAKVANSKERYVREWLCFMTAGQVVETSEDGETFYLPQAYRETLTGPGLVSDMSPYLIALPQDHPHLEEAFRQDGPPGIQPHLASNLLQALNSRPRDSDSELPFIIQQVPGLHGQLEEGIQVCEIGCGMGHQTLWMAAHYPLSTFIGIDINSDLIQKRNTLVLEKGSTNVEFLVQDAAFMPADWTEKFDYIFMYNVFHDIPLASQAAGEFYRALKKDGIISVIEVNVHSNPRDNIGNTTAQMNYAFSLYSCMSYSLSYPQSEALGTCAGIEKISSLLNGAGFPSIDVKGLNIIGPKQVHLVGVKDKIVS